MTFIGFFSSWFKSEYEKSILDNMEKEQSATILYTILGCVVGYISLPIRNFYLLLALVLGIYFITVIPLSKKITVDKLSKWLLSNTFVVYLLVWLIVYILLSNVI